MIRVSILGLFLYALGAAATTSAILLPPKSAAHDRTPSATAATQLLQTGTMLLAPKDTWLSTNKKNYSTSTMLATYTWPDYQVANAILMKFDLSALPAGAVVTQATLQLALVASDAAAESTYTVTAHKIVGKNPNLAKATGYSADGVTAWTANNCCHAGAPLAQADISPAHDTKAIDKAPGFKTWTITTMVQEWMLNPATNFGVLLNSDASKPRDRYRTFASMEHADSSLRPSLTITFVATDITPPSVLITTPAAGDVSGTVPLTASATDNVAVAGVQFQLNGTPLGPELAAYPYLFNWDTATRSDGSYTLTAVARDTSGNAVTSPAVTATVKNGLLFLSPEDTYLSINANNYSTDTVLNTYTWPDYKVANAILMKFDLSSVPPGAVVLEAKLVLSLVQSDMASTDAYTVTASKMLGRNPVIAQATGYTADGVTAWTPSACCYNGVPLAQSDISPAHAAQAIDRTPGFKSWTVTTMLQEWLADPLTNFGLVLNSDASKARDHYRFFASMEHPDSNLRPFMRITFSVDATPPSAAIMAPTPGEMVSSVATIAADATDDVGIAGVQLRLNGGPLGAELTAPFTFDWDTRSVANGPHSLTAVARDVAGNVTESAAIGVTVMNDTTPPVIAGETASGVTTSAAIISWSTDEPSDSRVEYGLTTAYGSLSALDGALVTTHSVTLSGLTDAAQYHFRARSRDQAGNLATSADFTLTTLDGTAPTVSVTAPAAGTTVSGTVTVAAGASDNVAVAGVQFKLDGANLGAEDTTSPYSVSWNTTAIADGSHSLTAIARDAAGNVKTATAFTVGVSNTAPPPSGGIAALYPGDVGIENDANVVLVERFDESTMANLFSRWSDVLNGTSMSISTDAPSGSPVGKSLNIPWSSASTGGHLYQLLSSGLDNTLYVRYYVKYPANNSYSHTGIWMGGNNPPSGWPNPQAGVKPTGGDRFIAAAEQNSMTNRFDHYNYWMGMRQSSDGAYWGNLLLNDSNVQATAGQWVCVEQMVKLNNPVSSLNGEHAIWLNGVKVSHLGQGFPKGSWSGGIFTQDPAGTPFEGFQWRNTSSLNLNWLWLQVYATSGSGSLKYAHVVAAKSYIGCLASGSAPGDTTSPTVSLSSPAAGASVSGTITVAATASDNAGVAGVQFKLNGVNLGAEDTSSPYSISWDTTSATNGAQTLTAVARDAAGNYTTSAPVSVSVSNVSSGTAVFTSNWDTAVGTSTTAVSDGGRWPNYWEFNNGTSVQLLSVVAGGVNGHNALRVQQRGPNFAANLQIDNLLPQSRDYYLRYYMKNDDTSSAGDHIVTPDTFNYANLTYMRKYGGATNWTFAISMYGCGYTYPIGHWGPSVPLVNGQWYRFEYFVDYVDATHIQVHPRVYDANGVLIFSDAQFLQSDFGSTSWNGRSDWTLASYYAAGHSFCVDPTWMNDFGLGNNGNYGADDTGKYWYFSAVEVRTDRWPGAVQ